MENNPNSKIIQAFDKFSGSPASIQRAVLETIQDVTGNSHGIVSAENPVALVLEMSSMLTAAHMGKAFVLNRRQYPVAAQTHEDLYPHLSELDWVGVFALPSTAKFTLSFQYYELVQMLKPYTDGTKLLRIPKGTKITVGDVDFLLEYPVNILQKQHGGFICTYDTTVISPIHELKSNIVTYTFSDIAEVTRFNIELELVQVTRTEVENSITTNSPIRLSKEFTDDYYYARVFTGSDSSGWTELVTTHAPDIFDPFKPTAVLKVLQGTESNTLEVDIPVIYNQAITQPNGISLPSQLGSRIKVYIYSTLGNVSMNLEDYYPNQFTVDFLPSGKADSTDKLSNYSGSLMSVRDMITYSNYFVSQGRDMLSFSSLRERVIDNTTGPNKVPVSHNAIRDKLDDNGFTIIKAVDYVTDRMYWAVRDTPVPSNPNIFTPITIGVDSIITSVSELSGIGTVNEHGYRLTITPDSLFKMVNGKMSILSKDTIDRLGKMEPEDKITTLNSGNYYYTPFHYVLNTRNNTIKIKPYYFDNPKVLSKSFVSSNNSVGITVTMKQIDFERTEKGYRLLVSVISNDAYKNLSDIDLWVQAKFKPYGDNNYVYHQGKLVGRDSNQEPIFQFDIETTFDVNEEDHLIINNFTVRSTGEYSVGVSLTSDIEIVFGVYGPLEGWNKVPLDDQYGSYLTTRADPKAILCEKITLKYGDSLPYLWTNARTYASNLTYRKYDEDKPLTYTDDVYEVDEHGGKIRYVDGEIRYNLVHRKGDPVVDKDGNIIYQYRKGDTVLDENGKPIVAEPRKTLRQLELVFIDASYRYVNNSIVTTYRDETILTYLDWLTDDLVPLNNNTLEQTEIKFRPISTIGKMNVIYNNGISGYIDAEHSLVVDYTVNKQIYDNLDVRKKISDYTIKVISEELKKETVSVSSIVTALVKQHGVDIIGLVVRNFANSDDIITYTALNSAHRATIKKQLLVESDNSISMREDVTCNFILHSPDDTIVTSIE